MGLSEALAKITDPYERKARLWPALLAGLPIFVVIALLYAPSGDAYERAGMLAAACGGMYLLASISRELGKRLEPKLYEEWGGKPTTQLLRHRNSKLEAVTKRRYHAYRAGKIATPFPTEAEEAADPIKADEAYQSAIRWLLNQTRDPVKFGLLLGENIEYGFRRNALGVRPFAIIIAILVLAWVLISQGMLPTPFAHLLGIEGTQPTTSNAVIAAVAALIMCLIWIFYFTKQRVRDAAFTYAETLLRACDVLD